MDAPVRTSARLAAVALGLLAAAWSAFVVVKFSVHGQVPMDVALAVLLSAAIAGAWQLRPRLVFFAGFGLLTVALAVGYYLGLFFLPTVALCWATGMTAAFGAPPATATSRRIERLLGWGLFAAMLAYAGFWFYLTRSASPHDERSTTKSLSR